MSLEIVERARRTWRSIFYALVPSWLSRGPSPRGGSIPQAEGEPVLWVANALIDGQIERLRQTVTLRFPSHAVESSLPYHAEDRGLVQGRAETVTSFRKRLLSWRWPKGHRVRGNPWAWLEQFAIYWSTADGAQPAAYTIDVSGNRFDRAALSAADAALEVPAVETYTAGQAWDWDGSSPTPNWGRIWTVMNAPAGMTAGPALGDPELWGGALGSDPNATLGQTLATPQDTQIMRGMLRGGGAARAWGRAGCREEFVIVSLTGDPPAPDGSWATNEGRQAAAVAGFRFWPIHHWVPLP